MNFFLKKKNVSRPSNPPDELAQNVSKKNPFRTNYSSIFSAKVQNLAVFFIYLHDSNSIFRAAGINSEIFSARTVININVKVQKGSESEDPKKKNRLQRKRVVATQVRRGMPHGEVADCENLGRCEKKLGGLTAVQE